MNKLSTIAPAVSPVVGVFGIIGGAIAAAFGGWNAGMTTLLILMGLDYVTGLIVAAFFKRSPKSESGALESRAGWKGLLRKGVTLVIVLVGAQLDKVIGTSIIRDAVVVAYIANETISLIENAGLMGVPIPPILRKAIDILAKKSDPEVVEGDSGNE